MHRHACAHAHAHTHTHTHTQSCQLNQQCEKNDTLLVIIHMHEHAHAHLHTPPIPTPICKQQDVPKRGKTQVGFLAKQISSSIKSYRWLPDQSPALSPVTCSCQIIHQHYQYHQSQVAEKSFTSTITNHKCLPKLMNHQQYHQ